MGETRLEGTQTRAAPSLETFGHYRVVGPLSKGGMAELSLALHTGVQGFSRVVALKRVLPTHATRPDFVQMFLDEARLAARLSHPNIVRIYELGQDGDAYFLAMEYLPGEDLRQLMAPMAGADLPIPCELAAHVVAQAADALHHAHELTDEHGVPLNLVHRDVSPSNVILTYDGHVKVVDFGIAKAASNAYETAVGVMKGKLGYFAPEQFSGAHVDRRCDVYALGIVLWELLTGTRLFVRDSAAATMAAASLGEVPPLATFRRDVPPELKLISDGALAHEVSLRFQTAGELRDALELYLRTTLRPTTRDVAEWVVGVGGTRRAELKLAIARGSNVVAAFRELSTLEWDDAPVSARPPSSYSRKRRSRGPVLAFALGAVALVGVAGAVGGMSFFEEPAPEAAPRAELKLDSEPPGAFVFLNGEPTGRHTPVSLGGLDPSHPVRFRLEKPGYASATGEVPLTGGQAVTRSVTLEAVAGVVRFVGVPKNGAVRVDGRVVLPDMAVTLAPGRYDAELLVNGRVLSTRRVAVVAGPQEVPLAP
ncbi:MAG: serine/threonine protein kinase [Myxococcales bacterium]|nr:serine/threonine protein kinase [Myxococcales bacterium]